MHHPAAARSTLDLLARALADLPERPGSRLHGMAALHPLLDGGGIVGRLATDMLGSGCRPVRAVLFDKTATTNWALGWHQDRTICVTERRPVEGFGPWTTKAGLIHVAPPFDLLTRMLTLRVHLDPVPADNAPLLIAPGSHRLGRVPVEAIDEARRCCGEIACLAEAGDIWLYSTPILHASAAATRAGRRRVLQVDYAAEDLPGGLSWLGI